LTDVIVIDKLTKSFKGKTVLEDVNMRLQEGRIYGIVGDNGSGKTVLLKLICGFMKPDSGTVTVNGKVIGKDADFPENTGIIIEAPGFLPNYSGMKNLEYLASIRGKIGKEQIESAMKTVGLDPSSKLRVGKYSLGMKQRLGIAQAIMEDQQLLILDEPMNALDKDAVKEMRRLFLSFKASGKTMLIVSHNEGDISTLCDEVYEFDGAKIKNRESLRAV
jgi:ABC-2 type transport system ATP-binding protein